MREGRSDACHQPPPRIEPDIEQRDRSRAGVPRLPPRRDPALNLAQETQMEIEHPAAPERRSATFRGWRRVSAVAALSVGLLVVGGSAVVLAASPDPAATQAPATSQAPAATGGAGQPSQSGNGRATSGPQRQSGTQGAGRHNCPGTGNGGGATSSSGGATAPAAPSDAAPTPQV